MRTWNEFQALLIICSHKEVLSLLKIALWNASTWMSQDVMSRQAGTVLVFQGDEFRCLVVSNSLDCRRPVNLAPNSTSDLVCLYMPLLSFACSEILTGQMDHQMTLVHQIHRTDCFGPVLKWGAREQPTPTQAAKYSHQ
jgi:hypothetical protein